MKTINRFSLISRFFLNKRKYFFFLFLFGSFNLLGQFQCDCPPGSTNIGSIGVETTFSNLGISSLSGCVTIAGTLIVDEDLSIDGVDIHMFQASEIVVDNGAEVMISNSKFNGCSSNQMWKGITVAPEATLRFVKNQISDAQYAIRGKSASTLQIDLNIFDGNFVGVFADVAPGSNSLLLVNPLKGNTFSCTSNLADPYSGQSPNPGSISFAGVHSQNARMEIGLLNNNSDDYNRFIGLRNGITAVKSVIDVYRCTISDLIGSNAGSPNSFSWDISGIGIHSLSCKPSRSVWNSIADVYIGINSYRSWLTARNNNIFYVKVGIRTKYWWQGAATIEYNFIQTLQDGIILDSGIQLSGTTVSNNNIICLGESGTGIFIVNCSVSSEGGGKIESSDGESIQLYSNGSNGIHLLNSPGWKIADYIITVEDVDVEGSNGTAIKLEHSNNCRLRRNNINGLSSGDTFTGIHINSSSESILCCNNMQVTTYGIQIESNCENGLIANNSFNQHTQALRYEETGVTGNQFFTGNEWHWNNIGFEAIHAGGPSVSDLSRFRVDPSQMPFDTDPPLSSGDWFEVQSGATPTCQSTPDCGEPEWLLPNETELDKKITENSFLPSPYGEVLQWQGNQYLYQKLSQNPILLDGNSEMQEFKSNIDNSEIEDLLLSSQAYDDIWQYSANESIEIDGFISEIEFITQQLDSLNLLLLATENEEEIINLLSEKRILLDLLTDKVQAYETTDNVFYQNVLSNLENQLINNAAISVDSEMGLNEKEVNNLLLSFWINNNELTQEEKIVLYNIASTCPLEGGESVFRARALYQTFQDDIIDWDQLVDCSGNQIEERGKVNADLPQVVKIYPNPTEGELFIDAHQLGTESAEVSIYDLNGSLVYREVLNKPIHKIVSINIPSGLYMVNISDGPIILDRQKLMIIK